MFVILCFRFGAPSRELYMGNYPFKGAFGGPPIFATINGVRHEIRLSGPPPEVKIEPDPCYELLRHMPRVGPSASGMGVSSQRSCADQGADQNTVTMDVKGLLAKLQKSGFLTVNVNNKKNEGPSVRGGSDSPNRSPTPPIPSEHRGEVTERLPKPPTDLMKFSMRALKIRYDSVVESLHQIRHVCPNCGLRFAELRGEKYQRHLDWHFRENLKSKERPRYRSWYLSLDEWLEFSEEEQLEASTSSGSVDANDGGNTTNKDAHAQDSNVPSDAAPAKECGVCKEKFEEYWDEDDDLWKLKDCVVDSSGSIFHTGCILDASMVNHSVYEDVKNEENCDKKSILLSVGDSLKRTLPVTQ
ncbi:hypothetical protein AB6A40_005036 [Gnathostoma spinigerum]|uniref:Pcf11 Clp1-ID domain-containing protein n=1 Tax=Gnathostoma spinigerum TaxID=75299 RepID=A0ABD6EGG2_9BILA